MIIKLKDLAKDNFELRAKTMVMLKPSRIPKNKPYVRYSLDREALRTTIRVAPERTGEPVDHPAECILHYFSHGLLVGQWEGAYLGKYPVFVFRDKGVLHIGCKCFGKVAAKKIIKWAQGDRTYGKTKRSK